MNSFLRTVALLAPASAALHAQLVINEIRSNDPAGDDFEYFELYNPTDSAISLDGLTYVVIGDGAGGSGVVEAVVDLTGGTVDAGAYYVVSNQPLLRIDSDSDGVADLMTTPDLETALRFENSDNVTHLLANAFTGGSDDDLDTNDDGTLDVTPWDSVVDAVSFFSPDDEDLAYATTLGAFPNVGPDTNGSVPGHIYRSPDGGNWNAGAFGSESDPGDGNLLQGTQDTPGAPNPDVTPLFLTLSESSVSEGAVNPALSGTVSRSGTTGSVTITLSVDDESEAIIFDSVFLGEGEASAMFDIEVVNDLFPDGAQTVTVTASAPGFLSAQETFEVTDDGDEFSVVFNEVYYSTGVPGGDANGDGLSNFNDHFIELVNVSDTPVDLSDYHMEGSEGTRFNLDGMHRFPAGTILEPGCAVVVFGGPRAATGHTEDFGTALVQLSSNNGLFLMGSGEPVRLLTPFGEEAYAVNLPDITASQVDGSVNLSSEGAAGDPAAGHDRHANLSVNGDLFSPGTMVEGDPFCLVTDQITISLLDPDTFDPLETIAEDALPGSVLARIEAPGREAGEEVIYRLSFARGDLLGPPIGTLDDANPSADVLLDPVNNFLVDGNRIETVSVKAPNYLNGSATIEVTDDGDTPGFTELVINEVDSDQTGSDNMEFVELYNLTDEEQALDGLVLVLINGNGDRIYRTADLAGFTIPANGFFVVGLSGVPNVDYTPGSWPLDNAIQNGPDAVALYQGDGASLAVGTPVTEILNPLIDAVVYDTSDGEDTDLLVELTPGEPQIDENGRGMKDTDSIQRVPDGGPGLLTSTYVTAPPTPGSSNLAAEPIEELVDLEFDFEQMLVIATVLDLEAGVTYSLESSVDAGQNAAFELVGTFEVGDPIVSDLGEGRYRVEIVDNLLGDLVANPFQIYRVFRQ